MSKIFLQYKALFQKQWYFMLQTRYKYILNIQEGNDIIPRLSRNTRLPRVFANSGELLHFMHRGRFFKFAQICSLFVEVNPNLMDK